MTVRIQHIHAALQRGGYPSSKDLAKELDVSERTIKRDFEVMRSEMNLPLAYHELKYGWYYTKKVTHVPAVQMSTGELLALFVAGQALAPYKGTSFAAEVQSGLSKITREMTDEVSIQCDELAAAVSFRANGCEVKLDLEVCEAVTSALLARAEIEFTYQKLRAKTPEMRRVHPHHLTCVDGVWYLLAIDPARKGDVRTFALCRMGKVRRTGKTFERTKSFKPEEHLANSIGIFGGGKPLRVKLEVKGVALRLLQERRYHPTQKLVMNDDEASATMIMQVAVTPELERWVMSWGAEVRVQEPAALRKKIVKMAREIVEAV